MVRSIKPHVHAHAADGIGGVATSAVDAAKNALILSTARKPKLNFREKAFRV